MRRSTPSTSRTRATLSAATASALLLLAAGPAAALPPVGNDTATVASGDSVVVPVLANDGAGATLGALTQPTHGSATANGDGTVTYTSTDPYHGADSFTYQSCVPGGRTAVYSQDFNSYSNGRVSAGGSPLPSSPGAADNWWSTAGTTAFFLDLDGWTGANRLWFSDSPGTGMDNLFVSDAISVTPGGSYSVDFDMATGGSAPLPNMRALYSVDGGEAWTTIPGSAQPPFNPSYAMTHYQFDLVAPSSSLLIRVSNSETSSNGNDGGIDNVSLTTASVSCSSRTVSVTVQGPPVAVADSFTVQSGVEAQLGLLTNDTDPEGGALTLDGTGPAEHGAVVENGDGTVTYTATAGHVGADSFEYAVCDEQDLCDVGTVTLDVEDVAPVPGPLTSTGVGTAPQSAAATVPPGGSSGLLDSEGDPVTSVVVPGVGTYSTSAGSIVFTPVLGYTGSPTPVGYRVTSVTGLTGDSTYAPEVTAPAPPTAPDLTSTGVGTAVQSVTVTVPTGGTLQLTDRFGNPVIGSTYTTSSGLGTYTLDAATGTISFQAEYGWSGTVPRPGGYRVTDAYGQSASGSYTPTVTAPPGPTPPLLSSVGPQVLAQTAQAPVPDDAEQAGLQLLDAQGDAASDVAVVEGTYTLTGVTITFTPAAGFAGTPTPVTYRLTDAYGTSGDATYSPYVVAAPTPVALTSLGTGTAVQQVTATYPSEGRVRLLVDGAQVLTVTVAGEGSYLLDASTGVITFTPVLGFAGPATPRQLVVTDRFGQTGTSTYTPAVQAPAGPTATALASTGTGVAEQTVTAPVPTAGLVTLLDGGAAVTELALPSGVATIDPATGVVRFVPVLGFTGDVEIAYEVTDAYGQTDTAVYTASVTAPPFPVAVDRTSTGTGPAPQVVELTVPEGGQVTFTDGSLSLTVDGEGTYTVDPVAGTITFVAELGFDGQPLAVDYRVTDAYGHHDDGRYTPFVELPPAPEPLTLTSTGVGTTVQTVLATLPEGGVLTLLGGGTTLTVPGAGTYAYDAVTGELTFTPVLGFVGQPEPLLFDVVDAYGQVVLGSYAPTVTAPAGPSVAPSTSTGPVSADQAVTIAVPVGGSVTLLDAAGRPAASVTVAGQGTYVLDPATGRLTFTPLAGYAGTPTPVSYRVTDAYGQSSDGVYRPTVVAAAAPAVPAVPAVPAAPAPANGRSTDPTPTVTGTLPMTGGETAALARLGVLMLVVGAVLTVVGLRRPAPAAPES